MNFPKVLQDCQYTPDVMAVPLQHPMRAAYGNLNVLKKEVDTLPAFDSAVSFPATMVTALLEEGPSGITCVRSNDVQERCSAMTAARRCFGNVLVVGAGLGVAQQYLAANTDVRTVTVYESRKDLASIHMELCPKVPVYAGYLWELFVKACTARFDSIYFTAHTGFDFNNLPVLVALAESSRRLLKPSSESVIYARGFYRMLDLYHEFLQDTAKGLYEGVVPATVLTEQYLTKLAATDKLGAESLRYLRGCSTDKLRDISSSKEIARATASGLISQVASGLK